MAKHKRSKHSEGSNIIWRNFPSAVTIGRTLMLSPKEELEALSLMPGVTERNRVATARIEQAETPEALLDLAAEARGLPRFLWQNASSAYGRDPAR
jgi:hypothetical protein